jgi:hypothetical protein
MIQKSEALLGRVQDWSGASISKFMLMISVYCLLNGDMILEDVCMVPVCQRREFKCLLLVSCSKLFHGLYFEINS